MVKVLTEYKGTFEVTKEFYEMFRECQSIDPTSYFMNNVYFDGEEQTFVATDGRRMIWHESLEIGLEKTGYYELAKVGKKYKLIPFDCDGQFPRWQLAIPDMKGTTQVKINGNTLMGISGKLADDSRLICKLIREMECIINIEFLLKVLKFVPSFMVRSSSKNRAILFEIDKDTGYVVMPMLED